jgi:epoxyqueuosine reductase
MLQASDRSLRGSRDKKYLGEINMAEEKNTELQTESAKHIEEAIRVFLRTSPKNRLPEADNGFIYDEPLVGFADGDDPIFTEYKSIIDPVHLTPREAMAMALNKSPEELPRRLSVISFVLPFSSKIRKSMRQRKSTPSRFWAYGRAYGARCSYDLQRHLIALITEKGYLAMSPTLQSYYWKAYDTSVHEKAPFSNWSERHIAYSAGLGTFSLSDGLITERGIAHLCGSILTDLPLPSSPRTASNPYSNCLFYANASCRACITRCPAEAITEKGHNKIKCREYGQSVKYLGEKYKVETVGCGFCQTKVPCEFVNPVKKLRKKIG